MVDGCIGESCYCWQILLQKFCIVVYGTAMVDKELKSKYGIGKNNKKTVVSKCLQMSVHIVLQCTKHN